MAISESMTISELILKLEEIRAVEGDLKVCGSIPHDYWGSIEEGIDSRNIEVSDCAMIGGPKYGTPERAVAFIFRK